MAAMEPIVAEFTLDLSTIVHADVSYDADGEPSYNGGVTFGDLVADKLAERMLAEAKTQINYSSYGIADKVLEGIREAIEVRVQATMDRQFTPTDGFGNAKGEPTTLAEQITKEATQWFARPAGESGGRSGRTNLQKLVGDAVQAHAAVELKKAVDVAIAEAKAQLAATAGELLINKIASGR